MKWLFEPLFELLGNLLLTPRGFAGAMHSLRTASICTTVVASANTGDYATIARLVKSGIWQDGDVECVVAGLLCATSLHDVHCCRGLAAAHGGGAAVAGKGRHAPLARVGGRALSGTAQGNTTTQGCIRPIGQQPAPCTSVAYVDGARDDTDLPTNNVNTYPNPNPLVKTMGFSLLSGPINMVVDHSMPLCSYEEEEKEEATHPHTRRHFDGLQVRCLCRSRIIVTIPMANIVY